MYIGSIEKDKYLTWIFDEDNNKMVKKELEYVPGFYKIYDELIVNILDHMKRIEMEKSKNTVKTIKINIDLVLFCKQYDIPLVVLGGWSLRFVKSKSIYFKSVKNTTECYIVRQPAFRPHRTPIFELITKNKKIKFKISTLPKQFHKIMYENVFEGDIKDFITKYIRYKN